MVPSIVRTCLFSATAALLLGGSSFAQTVATDPVGFVTINVPADSDTFVNLPLKRPAEFVGVAGALAGNKITFHNTTNLTPSQFVYSAGTQPKTYYVFIGGGSKAGAFYTVTANDATSITVDLAGDSLNGALALGAGGTPLQVIPYDTLGTVFPNGQGVTASTSHLLGARQTTILVPDQQNVGQNLVIGSSYYFYSGAAAPGTGWRKAGVTDALANDEVIYPDNFFIIRTKAGQASSLTMLGGVQMCTLCAPLSTRAANTDQDNPVALPVASNLTLKQTNLFESGAFAPSTGHTFGTRGDQLFVFDNTVVGHDKIPSKTYYYFNGANPGWRMAGDTATVRDTDVVISPTTAIIVRKKATATAGTAFWSVKPPYVP
jgi:uncharacterized protein (TIGR02597 family)